MVSGLTVKSLTNFELISEWHLPHFNVCYNSEHIAISSKFIRELKM